MRQVVDIAVLRLPPSHAAAPLAGNGEVPVDLQLDLAALGLQRLRQGDAQAGVVDQGLDLDRRLIFRGLAGHDLDGIEHVAVGVVGGAEAAAGVDAAAVGLVEVLVELQPQDVERVRAVIGVGDDFRAGQGRRYGIGVQRGVDGVVGAVLPVVRPRQAVG